MAFISRLLAPVPAATQAQQVGLLPSLPSHRSVDRRSLHL